MASAALPGAPYYHHGHALEFDMAENELAFSELGPAAFIASNGDVAHDDLPDGFQQLSDFIHNCGDYCECGG